MNQYRQILAEATEELLSSVCKRENIKIAIEKMHKIYSAVGGISGDFFDVIRSENTRIPAGTALSTQMAAQCIFDFTRTYKFIKGVFLAFEELITRFPNDKIRILYAGSGPYAPLIFPLITQFHPGRMQITILDIHKDSVDSVKKIVTEFGFEKYFKNIIKADAAYFKPSDREKPHLIITETMQQALEKEPQVAIMLNLAPHLIDNGIYIPERISLIAGISDKRKNNFSNIPVDLKPENKENKKITGHFSESSTAFEINAADCCSGKLKTDFDINTSEMFLSGNIFKIPESINEHQVLNIFTEVLVYENVKIGEREATITFPKELFKPGTKRAGAMIRFRYYLGANPGLRFDFI